MKRPVLTRLQAARSAKRPAALVTELSSGRQALLADGGASGDLPLKDRHVEFLRAAIAADQNGALEDNPDLFVQVFNPPLRLLIVGAVHITQALAPMAQLSGYDVTVIDPREAWGNSSRFPEVNLVSAWPEEALVELAPDHRTAIVTLTHDPKFDDPALAAAFRSDAFYIGSLGSRRTHGKRLERLAELGFKETDFARIHGPIGLAIGAKSPAEIALSILAQMTQVRHGVPALVRAP